MTDKELLEFVERRIFAAMIGGCYIDTHLGNNTHDTGSWVVSLRADVMSRLLDMARETNTGRLQKKLEQTA